MSDLSRVQAELEEQKFARWLQAIGFHDGGRFIPNDVLSWTPSSRPLSDSTVALVGSSGIYADDQPPFDTMAAKGDPSIREIAGDISSKRLRASHSHMDTDPANSDINCVFPLDRLRELEADRTIGRASTLHIGLMGFCPDPTPMRDVVAPAISARLRTAGADIVVLVPG